MQTTTSPIGTLNLRDLLRGLLVAVITPVFTIIGSSIDAGTLTFNWKLIGGVALFAGLSYIVKNFLTPATVVIPVTKEEIKSIKDGDKEAVITQTE
jgi:hypothetical protein